jgi:RNA polymerase sigma factor (sigma-70 family)
MTARPHRTEAEQATLSRAVESLSVRWAGIVQATAARYRLEGFDRDDLMQRVRVRLWRALERRRPDDPAIEAGYAHSAAVSAAIDIVREQRARGAAGAVPLHLAEAVVGSTGPGPDEAALAAALDSAMARLEPERRVAVRLHLAGHHARDIARMNGWTEAKARNQLYRGLADLRLALEGE